MDTRTGIEQALAMFEDSPTKLAKAIGEPVLRQHVEHWLKAKKVPADRAPDVERLTGIPCELLCPGVSWEVLRAQPSDAPAVRAGDAPELIGVEGAQAAPVEGVA